MGSEVQAPQREKARVIATGGSRPDVGAPAKSFHAASDDPPVEDHRVPGVAADPMAAHGHMTEELQAAIVKMRAAAETAVLVSAKGQTGDRKERWRFLNALDRADSPEIRAEMRAQFEAQTHQSLDAFVQTTGWHSGRDKAQAADLLSPERDAADRELAAKTPEERAQLERDAAKTAHVLLDQTNRPDIDDDASAKSVLDALGSTKSRAEMEAVRRQVRTITRGRSSAYEVIDKSLSGGTEDEALAGLQGDRVKATIAGVINAEGDSKRVRELLQRLDAKELAELRRRDPMAATWITASVDPSQREEIGNLVTGNTAAAAGAHVADLLKPPEQGFAMEGIQIEQQSKQNLENRKTENVIAELRKMSPAEIASARATWDAAHPDQTWSQMLQARFGDGDTTTLLRMQALVDGDRAGERALAVRQGMREQKQELIEDALANPDLASPDPVKRGAALAEQAHLELRMKALDQAAAQTQAVVRGDDPSRIAGASTQQQLAAYYINYGDTLPSPTDVGSLMDGIVDADGVLGKRAREADHNAIAASELRSGGKLSTTTELQRADTAGDAQKKAQLLENLSDNTERDRIAAQYAARYGTDVLADPHVAEVETLSREMKRLGDDRPLSELRALVADDLTSTAEQRVLHVRDYGVKAERSPELELALQKDLWRKQHSESFEAGEKLHELQGGNAGLTQLHDDELQNLDDMLTPGAGPFGTGARRLKDGTTREDFDASAKALTTTTEIHREEKLKSAEQLTRTFTTIAKLGAMFLGQPHLVFLADLMLNVAGAAIERNVAGSDADLSDNTADLKIDAFTDALGFVGPMASALTKADDVAKAERLGAHAAEQLAEHGATAELRQEIVGDSLKQAAHQGPLAGALDDVATSGIDGAHTLATTDARLASGASSTGEAITASTSVTRGGHALDFAVDAGTNLAGAAYAGSITGESSDETLFMFARNFLGGRLAGHASSQVEKTLGGGFLGKAAGGVAHAAANMAVGGADDLSAVAGAAAHGHHTSRAQKHAQHPDAHLAPVPAGEYRPHEHPMAHLADGVDPEPLNSPARAALDTEATTTHHRDTSGSRGVRTEAPLALAYDGSQHQRSTSYQAPPTHETDLRVASNPVGVVERANTARAALSNEQRQAQDAILAGAENEAQRVFLERAVAAGNSEHQLDQLRAAMRGMEDKQLLREFTGSGLIQLYQHSCVPTAYQIAIAEVDPSYALHLRNHPEEMMDMQRDELLPSWGGPHQRDDLDTPPLHLEAMLSDPVMGSRLRDPAEFVAHDIGNPGMSPTRAKDQALHARLEKATGVKYDVITVNDPNLDFQRASDGAFEPNQVPHARIRAALAAHQPVLFGLDQHQWTIVREDLGADGKLFYIVSNPRTGTASRFPADYFDHAGVSSFTLPTEMAVAPKAGKDEVASAQAQDEANHESRAPRDVARTVGSVPPEPTAQIRTDDVSGSDVPRTQSNVDEKLEKTRKQLGENLTSRGLADHPTFQNLDPLTANKVNRALHNDPLKKAGKETQDAAQNWALEGAGGDPREFANRYEYALATYKRAKGPGVSPKTAASSITPENLEESLQRDIERSEKLGARETIPEYSQEMNIDEVAARVQTLDRFGFESPTAEAYHSLKHREDVPTDRQTGNHVQDYANAARDTIKNGTVVLKEAADGGASRLVYHLLRDGDIREAIVYVGPDGSVTLATWGEPIAVKPGKVL